MTTFCRHGSLKEKCPICGVAVRSPPAPAAPRAPSTQRGGRVAKPVPGAARGGLKVRHEARAADDGYRCVLAAGLRAEIEARSLAQEVAFAAGRLRRLASDPPGLYGEAASSSDLEEATWLVFQIVYVSPLEQVDDAFATISAARTTWASGELPVLDGAELGPRTSAGGDGRALAAYRRWAQSAGSQEAAFTSDPAFTPERRFERVHERLSLPGFGRQARFDLLCALGWLDLYPLRAPGLLLTENDAAGIAAKRVFGIGDRLNLERRASALAEAAGVPIEALELGLANWAAPARLTLGVPADVTDTAAEAAMRAALDL